jgi:hypothetical protein
MEEDLSARICDHLKSDLCNVIVAKEEEIRLGVRRGRTDIGVSTVVDGRRLQVIIEHKRAHNPEVATGMRRQLIDRYLRPCGSSCGIFLVSWFDGFANSDGKVRNCCGADSPRELLRQLRDQAEECRTESRMEIGVFVLDCATGDQIG